MILAAFGCGKKVSNTEPSVVCLEELSGVVGEPDDAEYVVRGAPVGQIIVRLPGALYPDGRDVKPTVRAEAGGLSLTVAPGRSDMGCGSDSRSRYDVPVVIPDARTGPEVRVRVSGYRLPLRSTPELPVEFLRGVKDGLETIGRCVGEVKAGPATAMVVTAPSSVEPGVEFQVSGRSVDVYGNPASDPGSLIIEMNEERPDRPPLAATPDGAVVFDWRAPEDGVIRFALLREEAGREIVIGRSNPTVVTADRDRWAVAWGDPHSHTGYSDGFTTATPDAAFAYARDVMRLDFAAVTDHLEAIWGCPMTDAQRTDLTASSDRFNEDGHFTAFAGYEWTASFPFGGVESETEGHAHVLFDGEPAWCASTEPRCSTFASLVETLRPLNPVIVRHHTCASWAPALFMPVGDKLTPVVEIASSHGSCECGDCPGRMPDSTDNPDNSTRRWLASGRLYGLVGGSDNHHARPGATRFFRHGDIILDAGGLSAVRAESLTRRGILDGLRRRAVWATTGARILVDFRLGDAPMGDSVPAGGPVRGRFEVHGTDTLTRLTIWRGDVGNGSFVAVHDDAPGALDVSGEWSDPAPVGRAVYYLRAEQVDGEMAWSSPIGYGVP